MSWLRAAFVFGAVPLLFETALFFTWLRTGWSWWERAWLWALGLNVACLLGGAVCLTRHLRRKGPDPTAGRTWLPPALAAVVLGLNLPLGALYFWAVVQVVTAYKLEVRNESAVPVDSLVIQGSSFKQVELGPIPSRTRIEKRLHLSNEVALHFVGRQGDQQQTGTLDRFAGPTGGSRLLVVRADGVWEVPRSSQSTEPR